MNISIRRVFSAESGKGTYNYLNTQKKYELTKTILFFGISLAIFFMGLWSTKTTSNYLTIVAVLGCLPASKWAVTTFMFWRYKSLDASCVQRIEKEKGTLCNLYDMVFTSYSENYVVSHLVIADKTICGYSRDANFNEKGFQTHLTTILKTDGYKDITIKVFTDMDKYMERLQQLASHEQTDKRIKDMAELLKSVTL